ncbi:hypothetical protein WJD89_001218 [Klebsiella pneumoniae]
MTVSTEVDHNDYTGNGVTTSFPYTFRIFKKSDLTVQVADLNENITVLTLDTDYSVTGAGNYSGGNVVLMSPLANGWQISISRDLPVTQETDLRNQGKFFAEVHEDAFDKLTMLIQQCFSFLRLALRKPSFIANYYDALNNRIRNLRDPSQAQDAATKNYVDGQIVDNTNAWKAGDAILDQKIDSNFKRTLRTPDPYVDQLPSLDQLNGKILAFINKKPVGILPESGSASDVLIELGTLGPGYGVDLVAGARRYFKVTDYPGGMPNSQVVRNSDGTLTIIKGTNNTNAIKSAIADAQACNGVVYLPAPENGSAYLFDDTLFPAVTSGALWRGASLQGDGKNATKLIFDGGNRPAIHVKGTSGWPTNIFLQGISLYSANDFVGEGWKLQGITGIRLSDFAAYRFGDGGLSFSNGSAPGIFTEFNIIEDGWLENNKTNLKFRKDGGDGSFHGITLRNVISNNLTGQTGLDVGAGCVIYNADWNQVTFFGAAGVQWILNNGARNGFETLYFEGDGKVTNNGNWSTAGYWRVQSSSGIINDNSTIPFANDGYLTPTTPIDANFSAAGFSNVQALQPLLHNQTYRGLMRLIGNNAQALAVTGYDSGAFESQGLAIVSQSAGDSVKDIILRQLIHLNGITSFRPEYRFNYIGGGTQLSINSGGRHTGVMGRRTVGNISANASQQTITTDLALPAANQTFAISLHLYSADGAHRHVATYVGSAVTGSVASTALLITSHSDPAIAFPSASFVILDGGILRFAVTTSVDISYEIKVLGIGTY